MQTILVPLDGSTLAERAVEYATALSIPTAASLVLLRVELTYPLADVPDDRVRASVLTRAGGYLAHIATHLEGRGFVVQTAIRSASAIAETIVATATEYQADVIVMTSHGRTGPSHLLFGSVAEQVIAQSRIPVIVDHAGQPVQRELLLGGTPRLLVPLDGSTRAEAALDVAIKLARDLGGELVLLAVHVPNDVLDAQADVAVHMEGHEAEVGPDIADYLTRVTERLRSMDADVSVSSEVRRGHPADEVVRAAADTNAALIVMATHGRTGLGRAVAGSVAGRVIEHATSPVVLIGPATLHQL